MENLNSAISIKREALLLKLLNHQNIIKVHDFYKTKEGCFVYLMEYKEGYDLYELVTNH